MTTDQRLDAPRLSAAFEETTPQAEKLRVRAIVLLGLPLAVWYFGWLLHPERIGQPILYAVLIIAELFNLCQLLMLWWTCWRQTSRSPEIDIAGGEETLPAVDVFIPVYNEPVEIVEPTVLAATRLRGSEVRVFLLDDGHRDELRDLADRHDVGYLRRPDRKGAKAGNINYALGHTEAPFIAVFDCDHVPHPDFLRHTMPPFRREAVAYVQTPQYYANHGDGGVAEASWAQQALFFGPIARGKARLGAMFCCGTNMVLRRTALEQAGGFPEGSITEDFQLSIGLHERGWESVYVPRVLASGLGPEDLASYEGQQDRWARGCISSFGTVMRARLPMRLRLQYLWSSMFFLTGWTVLIYLSLPVIRILTGAQPLGEATADQFVLHFGAYFGAALLTVATLGRGSYAFNAYALMYSTFWVHVRASLAVLFGRQGGFRVTPKQAQGGPNLRSVAPTLVAVAALSGTALWGLIRSPDPATLNNVAFAALHVTVLLAGARTAFGFGRKVEPAADGENVLVGSAGGSSP